MNLAVPRHVDLDRKTRIASDRGRPYWLWRLGRFFLVNRVASGHHRWTCYTICINLSRDKAGGFVAFCWRPAEALWSGIQARISVPRAGDRSFFFFLPEPIVLNHSTNAEAQATLAELDQELHRLQRSIRLAIQDQLGKLVGKSLPTLEHNRGLVESIHQLLESHGLRVQCSECGHPAILRISPRSGIANGAFVFDHSIDGRRTFHGGRAVMPEIRLVAKPIRRKAAKSKKRAG